MRHASLPLAVVVVAGPVQPQERPSDASLTESIQDLLKRSPRLENSNISVEVNNGLVGLRGEVASEDARRYAGELAVSVSGVTGVVNLLQVRPPTRPDAAIARDVGDALRADRGLADDALGVDVHDGVVTLIGAVDSESERLAAGRLAGAITGVTEVRNRTVIERRVVTVRSDAAIAEEVRARIAADARLAGSLITVAVDNGVVTLGGSVDSADARVAAIDDAWVEGVDSVQSGNLAVRPGTQIPPPEGMRTDDEMLWQLRNALYHDPRVQLYEIQASMEGGVATLRGVVSSVEAKRAAGEVARGIEGVRRVDNRLQVQLAALPSDPSLTDRVTRALSSFNEELSRRLSVVTYHGTVYLSGVVDAESQRQQAIDTTKAVAGVHDVQSSIQVREAWSGRADVLLRQRIIDELRFDPLVDASRITVVVQGGVATLSGEVGSRRQANSAVRRAKQAGAKRVDNRLRMTRASLSSQ